MKKVILIVFALTALVCFFATSSPCYAGKKKKSVSIQVSLPADGGLIYGCYKKVNGQLRVVDSPDDCRPSEKSISWKAAEANCFDEIDNDGDTAIDCADTDCADDPICQFALTEQCTDGIDNDGDTVIDCADEDCLGDPACSSAR